MIILLIGMWIIPTEEQKKEIHALNQELNGSQVYFDLNSSPRILLFQGSLLQHLSEQVHIPCYGYLFQDVLLITSSPHTVNPYQKEKEKSSLSIFKVFYLDSVVLRVNNLSFQIIPVN